MDRASSGSEQPGDVPQLVETFLVYIFTKSLCNICEIMMNITLSLTEGNEHEPLMDAGQTD